jgi:hypothetical protein
MQFEPGEADAAGKSAISNVSGYGDQALTGVEPPGSRNTLQVVFATVVEGDARAGDEVLDRARDQHFIGIGCGGDTRGDMDGEASEVVAADLAFSGVEPDANFDPEPLSGLNDRVGAANGPGGTVEGGYETVTGGVDFLAMGPSQLVSHRLVV